LHSKNSVCPDCSTGCSIRVDQNKDVLYRLKPRENPQAQGSFMCDEGRFGWKYIHSDKRLKLPEQRSGSQVVSCDWDAILPAARNALKDSVLRSPAKFAVVISPWATVEEAWLLATMARKLSPSAKLAIGPVRVAGEDDHYPKDVHGNPAAKTRFTIRAEKCPNRRGVEAVIEHFQGSVVQFSDVLAQAARTEIETLYVLGGDPQGWIADSDVAKLDMLKLLIVQDLLESAGSAKAQFVLAGGAWAEKDGTFVNHKGLAQAVHRALRGPGEARPDGRILMDLAQRPGMFHAPTLRKEIAAAIPALAGLAAGDLGEMGVLLDSAETTKPQLQPA
jgi:NADH-quinone oxidoreductase subunit G